MIYTNNLNILKSEAPTSASGSSTADPTTAFQVCTSSLEYFDTLTGAYQYTVISDANITITDDSSYISINDLSLLLTSPKILTIISISDRQLRFITNNTNQNITYGTILMLPSKTYIVYDGLQISPMGNASLYDIYSFTSGKPSINTILVSKRIMAAALLTGAAGKAYTACTSNTTYDIWLNSVKVGYLKFLAGGTVATISLFGTIYLSIGDNLYVKTQGIQDTTLADVGIVLNIVGE